MQYSCLLHSLSIFSMQFVNLSNSEISFEIAIICKKNFSQKIFAVWLPTIKCKKRYLNLFLPIFDNENLLVKKLAFLSFNINYRNLAKFHVLFCAFFPLAQSRESGGEGEGLTGRGQERSRGVSQHAKRNDPETEQPLSALHVGNQDSPVA